MALAGGCVAAPADAGSDLPVPGVGSGGKGDSPYPFIVIGDQDTWLKKTTDQSADLEPGSEKCQLAAGSYVELQAEPEAVGDHLLVNTRQMLPGCDFSQGYVFTAHVADSSLPLGGNCAADISARQCAFLGTIAYSEGTNDRYDLIFGYRTFTDFSDHPRRRVCSGSYCSDAAGRYQFLLTTWDGVRDKLDLPDFTPASQDLAALQLIRGRGVYDLDGIDTYAEFSDAIHHLNREWASLPGSPYGQPTHSMSVLWDEYQRQLGQ